MKPFDYLAYKFNKLFNMQIGAKRNSKIGDTLKDISSKTQKAIQSIKQYDNLKGVHYAIKSKQALNEKYKIYQQMNTTYTTLYYGKQLFPNKNRRVQIFSHHQDYYFINAVDLLFPVRLFLRNVKNGGILFVGYDLPFPGLTISRYGVKDRLLGQKGYKNEPRQYTYKFHIKEDIMVILKKEARQKVSKIFVSFMANEEMFMFNLGFDHIGYPGMQEYTRKVQEKSKSEPKEIIKLKTESIEKNKQFILPPTHRLRTSNRFTTEEDLLHHPYSSHQKYTQQFRQKQKSLEKNFINDNRISTKNYSRKNEVQLLKRDKSLQKQEQAKNKKKVLGEFQEKQRKLKMISSQFKADINEYKAQYEKVLTRNKKTLSLIAPSLFLTLFVHKANIIYNKRLKLQSSLFVSRFLVKKFIKKLKVENRTSKLLRPKTRHQLTAYHMLQFNSRAVHCELQQKSCDIVFQITHEIMPGLLMNKMFTKAIQYRKKVRFIQRNWQVKYQARTYMLEKYAQYEAKNMIKIYKYLKVAYPVFIANENCHKLCYQYMKDESIKFKLIYDAYHRRVEEINEFVEQNEKIRYFNKGKSERKKKKYLHIPKYPSPPQHRFFRNLDILKAMIRGWMELEYKKFQKKNISQS